VPLLKQEIIAHKHKEGKEHSRDWEKWSRLRKDPERPRVKSKTFGESRNQRTAESFRDRGEKNDANT